MLLNPFSYLECYKVDVSPCGTGLVYGGTSLGRARIEDSGLVDEGVISQISKVL